MKISIKTLITIGLVIAFFAGLQGGKYFLKNRLQELGLLIAIGLYIYAAFQTAFISKKIKWNWWVFIPPFISLFIIVSYSFAFAINANTVVFPSIFASREFLWIFVAPAVYLLYCAGYELERIEKAFALALIISLFNYLFHYYRIDLEAAYFSDDAFLHSLVTHDEWRGYRLKPPTVSLVVLFLYSLMSLFSPKASLNVFGSLLFLGLCGFVYSLVAARAIAASLALSIFLYPIFFSRPSRLNLLITVLPVFVFALYFIMGYVVAHFETADGGDVRMASYKIAWENVLTHFIMGYGQSSGYSKTYQQIFGGKFFPSDLGLIGMAFKYGIVGICLYVYFNFYIFFRLIKANWIFRKLHKRHNPLIWALLIFSTITTINLLLIPTLAFGQGITFGAFSIAYTSCYLSKWADIK